MCTGSLAIFASAASVRPRTMNMRYAFAMFFAEICITMSLERTNISSYRALGGSLILQEGDETTETFDVKKPLHIYDAPLSDIHVPLTELQPDPSLLPLTFDPSGPVLQEFRKLPLENGHQLLPSHVEGSTDDAEETCAMFPQRCSQDSYCSDYPSGFCCHCRSGYYGNGRQCLPEGIPQRVSGKVRGMVSVGNSLVELDTVDLHAYMVVGDGRAFTTLSRVPELAGRALMPFTPIGGLFGWLFALETQDHENGFSITGAEFKCHTEVIFSPGNQHISIVQEAEGLDYHGYLSVDTHIHGDLPLIAPGATVQIEPYRETYQYHTSVVMASSVREYTVVLADGRTETFSFQLHQNITHRDCPHGPRASPELQQLSVERIAVLYEEEDHSLRYAAANMIGPVRDNASKPAPVNPCSDGTHGCHAAALCLPGDGTEFQCQCAVGYRGDGRSCYDVDECTEDDSICGSLSQCVNVPGSHHCLCHGGYQLGFDGQTCVDVDECLLQLCHTHASCTNSPGSFQCQCRLGYEGDGFLCLPPSVYSERPLTQCEQHRDALLGGLGSWGAGPMVGGPFVPQCNEDGQYRPLQCDGSTGQCWCVDSRGQERAGTRTLPGIPPTNCDQPVKVKQEGDSACQAEGGGRPVPPPVPSLETACERWRASLLEHYGGQPNSQDYMPQCDPLGHFEPVQCYGESTYCWCVDRDGREVIGTRSHDVVKPACIPTVAPATIVLQPRPDVTTPLSGPTLLYAQGQQIGALPLNGPHLDKEKASVLFTLQGSIVVGLGYDCQEQRVYWTDLATRTINRARLEPRAETETIINSGLTSPEGLAVDPWHRMMFWVDSGTDRIETSGLDGSGRRILFDADLVNPRAIVVDAGGGMLYWTDWNRDTPKIESSTVEGHDRKVLVTDGIGLPNALTFDPSMKHLCWADAGTKRLECMYPDGTGRHEIQNDLSYPFSLVFHGSHFYYSDWRREAVLVLSGDGSHLTDEYLPDQNSQVYGITVTYTCPSG